MKYRHVETAAVQAGKFVLPLNPGSSPPLFQVSSYEFEDLDEVEEIIAGRRSGAVYGRLGGPNGTQFAAAMAELEGADAAVGASAGMAAIDAALRTNLRPGTSIVATGEVYGGTYALLEKDYRAAGVPVVYVDQQDLAAVASALARERPAILYVEALSNPLVHVADLPALAEAAHDAGAILVVDATFATPVLARPVELGADLVVHSVGKYLGGHGDVGAGVLAGRAGLVAAARDYLVRTGATIPHFEAWLALRGLRTLALRMERHSSNAAGVAAALARDPFVTAVHHPSRAGHPQHELAKRLYPHGTGGMLAFEIGGGRDEVDAFFRGLTAIPIVHSLGEVATTIAYPAVSSHRPLPPEVRRSLGIGDGVVRLSVGIENVEDIVAELTSALAGLGERLEA